MKQHPKVRILLAEDDTGIREFTTILLEEKGYDVVTCDDGDEVIDRIFETYPNLLLLDLWMPGMTTEQIIRQVRACRDTFFLPIIVISANTNTAEIAQQLGADDFLAKPFDIEDLEKIVDKHLRRRGRK